MMPMPFRQIVGHGPVVDLLRHAVTRRRVPQSLIFAGPDGVGKRAVALALAQAINCPKQKDGDACGTCVVCSRIARGQFSDVIWLEKGDEASIKIQALRERILEAVGYRPFEGVRRVFIIEPADDLTEQAQDALLKTLEEPPSSAILILITAYPDTLLATIRSRCRRVRFGPLSERDVARVLVERAGLDAATATRRAAASGGSVARALDVEVGDFEEDRDAAMSVLAAARAGGVADRLKAGAVFAKHASSRRAREAAATRLAILASLLRDVTALGAGTAVVLANADLEADLRGFTGAFGVGRLTDAFAAVERASSAIDRSASPKIVADWLAIRL
jgi:DNA polymerase III subunit delta'